METITKGCTGCDKPHVTILRVFNAGDDKEMFISRKSDQTQEEMIDFARWLCKKQGVEWGGYEFINGHC